MVKAVNPKEDPDGVTRRVIYGVFREEQEAKPGYTKVMYNSKVDPSYYDKLDEIPEVACIPKTYVKILQGQVEKRPNS